MVEAPYMAMDVGLPACPAVLNFASLWNMVHGTLDDQQNYFYNLYNKMVPRVDLCLVCVVRWGVCWLLYGVVVLIVIVGVHCCQVCCYESWVVL